MRPGTCGWSADDWHAFFEKRAGVAASEARLPREEAEARAFACCVAEWLNRKLTQSPPGRCLGCGGSEHPHDKLLPFGTEQTGQAWLHSRCWQDWHASRKAEAVATLSTFGICMRTSGMTAKKPTANARTSADAPRQSLILGGRDRAQVLRQGGDALGLSCERRPTPRNLIV